MNCKCTLNEPLERHVFHDWDVCSLWRLFCIWKGVLVKKKIIFDWLKSILFDWQLLKWKCLQFGFGANNWRPKALTETCGLLLFLRKSIFDVFWLNFSLHFQILKVTWFWHFGSYKHLPNITHSNTSLQLHVASITPALGSPRNFYYPVIAKRGFPQLNKHQVWLRMNELQIS